MKAEEPKQYLSIKIDCFADTKEEFQRIAGIIKHYRYVARRTSAAYAMIELANADMRVNEQGFLVSVKKDKDEKEKDAERLSSLMKLVFNKDTGTPVEAFIKNLAPDWTSDLVQECRREILSRWKAKDPEKGRPRKYLVFEGERRPTAFMFAPVPIKWCPTCQNNVKFEDHKILVRLDKTGYVTLKMKRLDPYAWSVIKRLASGEFAPGGAKLQMNSKGHLSLRMGYPAVIRKHGSNPARVFEVAVTNVVEKAIECSLREGHKASKGIPVDEVRTFELSAAAMLAGLDRLHAQSLKWEEQRKSCGGNNKAYESCVQHSESLTKRRDLFVKDWCHTWAKRIVERAVAWDCGKIIVTPLPAKFFERPFQWSMLKFYIEYKAKIECIGVVFEEAEVTV